MVVSGLRCIPRFILGRRVPFLRGLVEQLVRVLLGTMGVTVDLGLRRILRFILGRRMPFLRGHVEQPACEVMEMIT